MQFHFLIWQGLSSLYIGRRKKVHKNASVFQILKCVPLSNLGQKEKNIWQFNSALQSMCLCSRSSTWYALLLVRAHCSFVGIHIQVSYPSVSSCRHLTKLNDLCLSALKICTVFSLSAFLILFWWCLFLYFPSHTFCTSQHMCTYNKLMCSLFWVSCPSLLGYQLADIK